MKIERVFINRDDLLATLTGEREVNLPVGYAYCSEEQGLSCSVFLGTDRETKEIKLTSKGDLQFNIKTKNPHKGGDHAAQTEGASVEAEAEAPL